jgi:hypothetical protein
MLTIQELFSYISLYRNRHVIIGVIDYSKTKIIPPDVYIFYAKSLHLQ